MSKESVTFDTYNRSADALAKKFDELGPRIPDINYVFSFCKKMNPFVLEIGCGNGRDAQEIYKLTNNYLGIDSSEKLLEIAKRNLPDIKFLVADIKDISIPLSIDIVFAFASLIHIKKEAISLLMQTLANTINPGGLVFISCKYSKEYKEVTKEDEFGTRTYWHYNEDDMHSFGEGFTIINIKKQTINNQEWIDVLYQLRSAQTYVDE